MAVGYLIQEVGSLLNASLALVVTVDVCSGAVVHIPFRIVSPALKHEVSAAASVSFCVRI